MSKPDKELYEFSRFRLDVSERLLRCEGKRVALTDKAFDTLCILVRRGGELVGKDELMNEVWTDSIVEENNLDQKISMLRQALGERGGKGKEKFIETVRGHGYRFLPQVRRVEAEEESPKSKVQSPKSEIRISDEIQSLPMADFSPAAARYETQRSGNVVTLAKWRHEAEDLSEPSALADGLNAVDSNISDDKFQNENQRPKTENQNYKIPLALFAGIIAVGLSVAVFFYFTRGNISNNQTSDAPIDSIAVLPFENAAQDANAEYLSDGITESLINRLSLLSNLKVMSSSSVFRYKGTKQDTQKIGNELNVRAVLTGSVKQIGDQLIINVRLDDAQNNRHLWGEQYVRKFADVLAVQSDIVQEVSTNLRLKLTNADEQQLAKRYTENAEAYQLYLQGLYHWNKRTAEDIRKSLAFFQQAIDKDPLYAKAYAGLASAYLILPDYSQNLTRQEIKEVDLKRRAALRQAQELDDSLAEVHAVLATLKEDAWDFAAAENEYRRAIELNPNLASAHQWYSRFLGARGRYEEAFAEINKAHELDPFSRSINFNVGARFADARRFDEAITQYRRVLEMEPNHPLTHLVLAQAYEAKGMYLEAIAETRTADVLLEKESAANAERKAAAFTQALKTGGAQGYWRKRLELSLKEYDENYGSAYKIAVNYARLGDQDRAFVWLEKSFAAHEADLIWLKTESAFDGLNSDPRFSDLLRRIGL